MEKAPASKTGGRGGRGSRDARRQGDALRVRDPRAEIEGERATQPNGREADRQKADPDNLRQGRRAGEREQKFRRRAEREEE